MNALVSNIKANLVLYIGVVVAFVVFVVVFLRRGGDVKEFDKFMKTVEELRINRAKQQGRIDVIDEDNEVLQGELDEVNKLRRNLERKIEEDSPDVNQAREELEDFLRRYGRD